MKRIIVLISSVIVSTCSLANINFIDISKISKETVYVNAFRFIKENQSYYNSWTNEWRYDKPKEEFIKQLRGHYSLFSSIATKNEELYLLLGDISHYLYNLDDTAYYDRAVQGYDSAIISNPGDFRAYWFLGNHYALSNVPVQAIENLFKAEKLLPASEPVEFWNDYAWAASVANMPSHCIFAMSRIKTISGKPGSFETQVGKTVYERIIPSDKSRSYKKEDIWTVAGEEKNTFTCRPLGIKIGVDSSWQLTVYDYENHQAVFLMNPPSIKNKKEKAIHYTIALIMKTGNDNDQLDDFIGLFVSKYAGRKKIAFSDKYDKMIAYEIKDKTMYQDIGGGHLYMLGIERSAPAYPGLLLETPATFPDNGDGQMKLYKPASSKGRFKGKIFYAILLDTCEDIHEQSLAIFKTLFNEQIVIE
jgi:tetratricopeptide (TPR) repeat protein